MTDLRTSTRALLAAFSLLTFLAVIVLSGRPGATGRFFAWTIEPPLTAAFLGAGYAAGCVLVALSLWVGRWSAVRAPLLVILVFTALTLLATLLHLDRFHLHGPASIATFAGWFWLVIYIVIPPSMLVAWVVQDRASAPAHASRTTGPGLPRPLVALLAVQGALMLAVGVILFTVPGTADTLWPWTLTPLTSRAVAAWLIAFGLGTLFTAVRGRPADSAVQALAYTVFGAAELLTLLRFADVPDWSAPITWIYLVAVVAVIGTGVYGSLVARADPTSSLM